MIVELVFDLTYAVINHPVKDHLKIGESISIDDFTNYLTASRGLGIDDVLGDIEQMHESTGLLHHQPFKVYGIEYNTDDNDQFRKLIYLEAQKEV